MGVAESRNLIETKDIASLEFKWVGTLFPLILIITQSLHSILKDAFTILTSEHPSWMLLIVSYQRRMFKKIYEAKRKTKSRVPVSI